MTRSRWQVSIAAIVLMLGCESEEGTGGSTGPGGLAELDLLGVLRDAWVAPNELAPSASGQAFFLGDARSALVSIIGATDPAQRRTFVVEETTLTASIAASPLGRLLFLAAPDRSGVLVYDLATGLPDREPLLVGQGTSQVGASPDGRFVVAASGTSGPLGLVVVFDAQFDYQVVDRTLVLDDRPAGLAMTRHSTPQRAYVVGAERGKIFELEFDPSRVVISDSLLTGEPQAGSIVLSPVDETMAYVSVSNDGGGKVLEVDLSAGIVRRSFSVGSRPLGLDIDPDGRYVVVANHLSRSLSLIDIERGIVILDLSVLGHAPTDVLFTSDRRLYVSLQDEPGLAVLDLAR
ncbi:MAG: YncE family protein [Candidatus Eiseniibacteriota bacterium]|jgi:DNA-binding beta-propeller fold protein YncE